MDLIKTDHSLSLSTPFDPLLLSTKTESHVVSGNKRKYKRFGTTPDYKTGIATGYSVGCNLRCNFCWASETRDKPDEPFKFYSPDEVFDILYEIVQRNRSIDKMRISDGEPTLGRDHLLELVEYCERSNCKQFVIETNGIILGSDKDFVKELSKFKKIYVRLSLKAGSPEMFRLKTGAVEDSFYLPFEGIKNLSEYNICFTISAMSADPRFMSPLERVALIVELGKVNPELVLNLEEEMVILFPTAKKRINKYLDLYNNNLEAPLFLRKLFGNYLQVSYPCIKTLFKQKISVSHTVKNIIQLIHGI
ncbi:radical SAM protein [Marinilabiliaceae bacterium ANBcel2]|nr:radical SAM protein [Marinilabiliaceae bacterium ANBcel2]